MLISRHVIFALIVVCSASKHSGTDTQASWYEDKIYNPGSKDISPTGLDLDVSGIYKFTLDLLCTENLPVQT